MKQYYAVKAVHPDAILLFRVGDFYETFGDDAIKASGILGITLTRRANGAATFVELAGFPYHAIDTYLPKLVRAGERVAMLRTARGPQTGKGLSSGASSSWLRRAWCWEIIFWPTRKIPIWRRSISAGKIPAWLSRYFNRRILCRRGQRCLHRQTHFQPGAEGNHLPARIRRPLLRCVRQPALYLSAR